METREKGEGRGREGRSVTVSSLFVFVRDIVSVVPLSWFSFFTIVAHGLIV
jgi:hypothetical protein